MKSGRLVYPIFFHVTHSRRGLWLPDGLRQGEDLATALHRYPLQSRGSADDGRRFLITEVPIAVADRTYFDQPIGASFQTREFAPRGVTVEYVEFENIDRARWV